GSEWVNGDKDKLISIVLSGLTGPVRVRGRLYQPPGISGEMPGFGNNKEYSDGQIAQALSLIRRSWSNVSELIIAEDIGRMRKAVNNRQIPFTSRELNGR
nr:dehydrogenase [Chitinophagaceae bacterium]